MNSRPHTKTTNTRNETSAFSTAPAQGMFKSRPFVVQSQTAKNSQQKDLKTSLMRAERYGHHLNQMDFANQAAPQAAQLKMEMGQPVQCAGNFSFNNPFKKRPPKPTSLQGTDPVTGNSLTAHHKYGLQEIKNDFNTNVLPHPNPHNTPQGQNYLNWADPPNLQKTLTQKNIAWTPHNVFMGPLPENRLDDPGKVPGALYPELDTHFTASGSVTPNSSLALDIYKAGGIAHFNPADLTQRLNGLSNQASPYNPAEWTPVPTANGIKYQQTGMPSGWHTKMNIDDRRNYDNEVSTYKAMQQMFR